MPHEGAIVFTFENVNIRSKGFCVHAKANAVQICFLRQGLKKLSRMGNLRWGGYFQRVFCA